jgi:hypothetical protein
MSFVSFLRFSIDISDTWTLPFFHYFLNFTFACFGHIFTVPKKPGASFIKLTYIFDVSHEIHFFVKQCNRFLFLNTKPELQWQILIKNISQKIFLCGLFLDSKFCKKMDFS